MTANIARTFARYIALPVVSAGVIGGAAIGLGGIANATTTITDQSSGSAIATSPDTCATPAPNSGNAGGHITATTAYRCWNPPTDN